jgi:hypothetical protein
MTRAFFARVTIKTKSGPRSVGVERRLIAPTAVPATRVAETPRAALAPSLPIAAEVAATLRRAEGFPRHWWRN